MDKSYIEREYRSMIVRFEYYLGDILTIVSQNTNIGFEGNAFYHHNTHNRFPELLPKQMNLLWAGTQVKTRMCEIGFNAGHSALLMLNGCPTGSKIEFTIFDIGHHNYTKPCIDYVQSQFPNVAFEYIEGNSIVKMGGYIQQRPEVCGTYDVVHVDGGHTLECITADFAHASKLVRKGGIIIVDDTNMEHIDAVVNRAIKSGDFIEVECFPTVGYQHRIIQSR
jgi:cephalosporin hydroxylase